MSVGELAAAAAALGVQLAVAVDGAVVGVALAYVAVRSILKFTSTSSALRTIRDAPSVNISDLRFLIDDSDAAGDGVGTVAVVRGTVASGDGSGNSSWLDVLFSHDFTEAAVIVHHSRKYIYNEWRGYFGVFSDLRSVFARAFREHAPSSIRMVPFVLAEESQHPQSDCIIVNMEGSNHQLPLATVFHQMQPIRATPYSFLQALFGYDYPVGVLDEEKILALGKDITAVGIYSSRDGIPEIKSCRDLPYFLSDMTKDQMVLELSSRAKFFLWSGIIVGSASIGILGYAILRNWTKWKEWRERRRLQQEILAASEDGESEIGEDIDIDVGSDAIPEGQLCVICFMRRRKSAFVPCGHLLCCQLCALFIQSDVTPKCPLCRQSIRTSVRIYDS